MNGESLVHVAGNSLLGAGGARGRASDRPAASGARGDLAGYGSAWPSIGGPRTGPISA